MLFTILGITGARGWLMPIIYNDCCMDIHALDHAAFSWCTCSGGIITSHHWHYSIGKEVAIPHAQIWHWPQSDASSASQHYARNNLFLPGHAMLTSTFFARHRNDKNQSQSCNAFSPHDKHTVDR